MKKGLYTIIVLMMIVAIGWIGIKLILWFINSFTMLCDQLKAGIIALISAVILTIISQSLTKYYELKSEIRREHRNKKVPIYEEYNKIWFDQLMSEKTGKRSLNQSELIERLSNFTQQLIIWGSDSVILAYSVFMKKLIKLKGEEGTTELLKLFEKYLFEVRKDLGHKNQDLKEGDILKLFISDSTTDEKQNNTTAENHDI
jgi:hypothetical protein